jgi:hypothetical protein
MRMKIAEDATRIPRDRWIGIGRIPSLTVEPSSIRRAGRVPNVPNLRLPRNPPNGAWHF